MVVAALELDLSVMGETDEVARAIEATPRDTGEGIVDEGASRLLGVVEVATADTDATDAELTADTLRNRLEQAVEDVDAGVGKGAVDGDVAPGLGRQAGEDRLVVSSEHSVGP